MQIRPKLAASAGGAADVKGNIGSGTRCYGRSERLPDYSLNRRLQVALSNSKTVSPVIFTLACRGLKSNLCDDNPWVQTEWNLAHNERRGDLFRADNSRSGRKRVR